MINELDESKSEFGNAKRSGAFILHTIMNMNCNGSRARNSRIMNHSCLRGVGYDSLGLA